LEVVKLTNKGKKKQAAEGNISVAQKQGRMGGQKQVKKRCSEKEVAVAINCDGYE